MPPDEVVTTTETPAAAPAEAAVSVPVAATPEPAAPAPAPAETPVVADAGAAAPEADTLLSEAAAEKPAVEAAAELAKPVEQPPVEPLAYQAFALPEGLPEGTKPDDAILGKFTEIIGPHHLPQEQAQQLFDLHVGEIQKLQQRLTQDQLDAWHGTVNKWADDFKADPEFKDRVDATLNDAKWAMQQLAGSEEQLKELRWVLGTSGLGNHRAVIRILSNAAKHLREGTPVAAAVPGNPRPGDPASRRYGSMRSE